MELEFDRDVIQGYEVLADGTVCQEETLELSLIHISEPTRPY